MTTHFHVVLVLIMNSVITSPPYMPLPSLCLILGQCPKTVLPKDSGHTWSEIGNIWILTLYGFVGYTYKQNVEGIFYHWSDQCTCQSMSWWLHAFNAKDTVCILKSTCWLFQHIFTTNPSWPEHQSLKECNSRKNLSTSVYICHPSLCT